MPKSQIRKKFSEDEQTLVDLSSGHRRSQGKCQLEPCSRFQ